MKRLTFVLTLALPVLLWTGCADHTPPLAPDAAQPLAAAGGPHVVQVAPPTGDVAEDRARILAALEQVREGGTVLFAPGTYLIGNPTPGSYDYLQVGVPRVTLLGHPAGTTIRGCSDPAQIGFGSCHGLLLTGGFQTVRNFTFVDLANAVVLGRRPFWPAVRVGGYRVEDNEFRATYFGVSVVGEWPQPAVVRNNRFVNNTFGVMIYGRTAHVVDNDFSAPEPHLAPIFGEPWIGIGMFDEFGSACEHNLLASNRIDGYESGIVAEAYEPGLGCRQNVVRDNLITNARQFDPEWPARGIGMGNFSGFFGPYEEGLLEDNLVQGNRILGSQGQGVVLYAGQRNRIVNNTITDISLAQSPGLLGEHNGSGVWLSPQSRENQLLSNTFAAVASYEVVLEGDHNHVATRSRWDVVLDLGIGNRVTGPGSVITAAAPATASKAAISNGMERHARAQMLRQRLGASAW